MIIDVKRSHVAKCKVFVIKRIQHFLKNNTLYGEWQAHWACPERKGCEKCNLRKAVGNLEMPYGFEITVIVQEGLKTFYMLSYIG